MLLIYLDRSSAFCSPAVLCCLDEVPTLEFLDLDCFATVGALGMARLSNSLFAFDAWVFDAPG
jgi:hypothetical protein